MSFWTSLQSPFLDPIFQLTDAKGLLGGGVFEAVLEEEMRWTKGRQEDSAAYTDAIHKGEVKEKPEDSLGPGSCPPHLLLP